MTVEQIRNYCLSLPAVTESIKWGNDLCFCIGDKMFFVIIPDNFPVTGSFKTSDEHFEELVQLEGMKPAPYLARYMWVHYESLELLTDKQWKYFIDLAYQLVYDKLPLKIRTQLAPA